MLSSGDHEQNVILVVAQEESDKERLKKLDIDIIDSYNRYTLVKVNQDEIKSLEEKGFQINQLEERGSLYINGERYDIKRDLREFVVKDFEKKGNNGKSLFLVHMIGPVNPDWRSKLSEYGVDVLNYIPNYAYLVRMDYNEMKKVKDLFFVDDLLRYGSIFKMDEDIKPGRVRINFLQDLDEISGLQNSQMKILSRSNNDNGCEIRAQISDKDYIQKIAERNDVYSITSYKPNELKSELQSQIVGGYWGPTNPSTPYRGNGDFGAFVNQIGYTGKNVTIGIADTGIGNGEPGDAGVNDFTGRVTGGIHYSDVGNDWSDGHGHGTHVTGIAAGNTYHGNNLTYAGHGPFYLAQGLAYDSDLFAQKIFSDNGGWIGPENDIYSILEDAKREGDVYIHSNSWGEENGNGEYDYRDSDYDKGVRDSDSQSIGNQPMIVVVSAGNEGNNGFNTIASPGNGKNVITVGATENYMPDAGSYGYGGKGPDDPYKMFNKSSKGWTTDNRVKPTVIAPGEAILSTSSPEDSGTNLAGLYSEDHRYEWSTGTSQSTPAGAGSAAVIVEYFEEEYGTRPSPAMVKSMMINSADDLQTDHNGDSSIDHIPNRYEGWGLINLTTICDPGTKVLTFDQESLLETGQTDEFNIGYHDPDKPLKLTLSWTDKEAQRAQSGDDPAIKNDLNLEVTAPNGDTYLGNAFENGYTQPGKNTIQDFDRAGDGYDDTNVVENIFIPSQEVQRGRYTVKVTGEHIPADANNDGFANQDYALMMYNADNISSDGTVNIEKNIYSTEGTVNITVKDRDLTSDTVPVNISSDTETDEKTVHLNKIDSGVYTGSIKLSDEAGKGDLQVSDGDDIIVKYYDEDIGSGESEVKEETAFVDGSPPNIINKNIESEFGTRITVETDERCTAELKYGKNRLLDKNIKSENLVTNHTFNIENLKPGSAYSYEIICEDKVGNRLIDNNSGELYKFRTSTLDDFKSGNIGWNATANWELKDMQNISSNNSWVCGDGGYGTGWYEVLISPATNLSGLDVARLSLFHKYDFEKDRDGGIVQIKTQGGWQTIGPENGYDGVIEYGHGNELEGEYAFTGEENWTSDEFIINRSSCKDEFKFRFVMGTDHTDSDDFGWVIDHVKLNGTLLPVSNFSFEPNDLTTSDTVHFYDESYDPDGKIVNWTWDFGDGNTSYEKNTTHSYYDNGQYKVQLEVTDDFGMKRNISKSIYVSNELPTANFTTNRTTVRSGDFVKFIDKSFDSDGRIVNWTWDFGDGNKSYVENPTHRYITDDNFLVKLSVRDDDGLTAHKMKSISVNNGFPTAKFNYTPQNNITIRNKIQFGDLSKDIDGTIVNWTWDFGDGQFSHRKNPEHRYSDNGDYRVSLTVVDDDGAENITVQEIFIENIDPDADFTYTPNEIVTNTVIMFQDKSSDPDGHITEWTWNFGDGTTSSLQNTTHEYADDGTYTVELKVIDEDGSVSTINKTIEVANVPPKADFTYEYKNDRTSGVLYFYANCSDSDGRIVNWTWDFGDGSIKYGRNVTHEFDSDGDHEVRLIVTDDDGDSDSVEKKVTIQENKIRSVDVLSWLLISVSIVFVGYGIWALRKEIKYL
ncbi:MAG: PKD domain-containing protein [Thermoplasmata archaeon]